MQLERAPEAVAIYKVCAKGCEKDSALQIEMSKAMKHCTLQWVAQASPLRPRILMYIHPSLSISHIFTSRIFRRACPMT